ncbi:T9SS type B sorting domain-containing protein [Hymenobacter cheonanensis]|uniref:T9SS type B sorting domain-containing protein n=1 Tax=Hymenobacter sp. CA2-7 TaxID=3063993 RepID=UPI0027125F61|nr:gliding motility-associated C-terminal domain-containing protein [Hymenobacter sp. CA2-7]MDO7884308.1 gliding motility-associated C-terminal domain-containing protein [Hymenobacter sp. CA2-7]
MPQTLLRRLAAWPLLLGLLAVLLAAHAAQATHLLGGEMTYRYLDASGPAAAPYRYELTVTIYNNCNAGAAAPNTNAVIGFYDQATGAKLALTTANYATTTVAGTNGTAAQTGIMNITTYTISDCISPHVPAGCTVTGPSQPFRLQKFVGIVNLPASTSGFYAVFTRSARNTDITNIVSANNQAALTLYATIAPQVRINHSPVFADTAVAIICQGDTTITLNNASDADGDRLVYAFGTPYTAFATGNGVVPTGSFTPPPPAVTYNTGYSMANPFGAGAGNFALLNASTGVARYGALTQGKYVVAVDVSEYRTVDGREVLIGTTRRDLQLVVVSCPATKAPVLPTVAVLPRSYTIEEGQTLTIPLSATQADAHPLLLTVNSALLDGAGGYNATFNNSAGTVAAGALTGTATATGTGAVAANFVFTPACGSARTAPFDVAFTVRDLGCAGKTVADVIRITVTRASGPTAISGDLVVCDPTTNHTYTATGGTPASVRWRITNGGIVGSATGSSVQVKWNATGTGTLVARGVSTYGCLLDSVSQSVLIAPAPVLTITGNRSICAGSSTTLSVTGSGTLYTLVGGGTTQTGPGPFTVAPTQTTTYTFTSSTLTSGCASVGQATVTVLPTPAADSISGPASVCPTVTGVAYSVRNPHATVYNWVVVGGTIAGGQGTTAITVDWGATGAGSVSLTATNAQGCTSGAFTLPVIINRVLKTATPTGPTPVCQADGPYTYQTILTNGSSYSWQLSGTAQGTLVNMLNTTSITFTRAGLAKLVVTETSNPAGGICRGVSDTLYITVKPSPAPNLAIQGPDRFCVNSGAVTYTLPGLAGSTYVFQLNGATVASTGNSVVIPATTAVGTYTLTVRETTAGSCAGPLYTKQFTVDPRPGAVVINGPRFVCPASGSFTYVVPNAAATSTFQWAVTDGTITAGQGTASITVSFPTSTTTTKTVSVTETSVYGCAGAPVTITVVPDNAAAPVLTVASVDAQSNARVNLTFAVANAQATPNPVRVLRRPAGSAGAFQQVGTVAATATTYADATAQAAQTAYEYRLELTNGCGDVLANPLNATTILLTATATPGRGGYSQGAVQLSWTAYQGFAVSSYQVYQQNDNAGYKLVATVGGTTLQASVLNGAANSAVGAGFNQCFRVVATSAAGAAGTVLASNSNTACVDFANKLAFYNIITPNGDGQNDAFVIDNITLYPGNSLSIFNRWGRQVFTTTNYQNNWGTEAGTAPGMYYYLFKLADGTTTKGWVEVVK